MKKLVIVGLVSILILFGSGSAAWVDIKGNQKYITDQVRQMVSSAADQLGWGDTIINLKAQSVKKEDGYGIPKKNFAEEHAKALEEYDNKVEQAQKYLDEGKIEQYNKKIAEAEEQLETKGYKFVKTYDGFRHVLLVGTITGEDGQREQIVIDADTGKNVTTGVTVVGSDLFTGKGKKQVAVDRDATVQNGVLNIERDVSTSGQFNSTNFMTIWRNNASVSTSVATITGDNVTAFAGVSAQGSGSYQLSVITDNFINQQSQTAIAVSGKQKGKNK